MSEKKLYDVKELRAILPMSMGGIYKAVAEGKIPSCSVGKRKFIPAWFVDQLLAAGK